MFCSTVLSLHRLSPLGCLQMEDKSRKPTDTEEVEEDEPEAALELDDEDASMPDAEPAEIEINSGAPTAAGMAGKVKKHNKNSEREIKSVKKRKLIT